MTTQARQKFRIYHAGPKRMIYIAVESNDTSIVFNEWGWEVFEHFTGKMESLAKEEDGSILMQSTGIFDKIGVLIFEGDLVLVKSGILNSYIPYEIKWNPTYACYAFCQNGKFVKMLDKINLRTMNIDDLHVLGTVFEHPEYACND